MNSRELKKLLEQHYNISVKSIEQGKGYNLNSKNYLITSLDNKKYYLKKQDYSSKTINQIKAMDFCCINKKLKLPSIISTKEDKCFFTDKDMLFLLTKFYDGKHCSFTDKEIYSAGKELVILNKHLKDIGIEIKRDKRYDNLTEEEINIIRQKTKDKNVLLICDKLQNLYDEFPEDNDKQLVHFDYNINNVLFKDGNVDVILDCGSIVTSSLTQSIAFGCDRFSWNKKNMMTFLRGCIMGGFDENKIDMIPQYIVKEATQRINYILRTDEWLFDINKQLKTIKRMGGLKWI